MGAVAKGTIKNGGKTIGIVPEPLFDHGSAQLGETVVVPDMHARKKLMAEEVKLCVCVCGKKKINSLYCRVMHLLYFLEVLVQWKKCWK
jgi:hypothetical protein